MADNRQLYQRPVVLVSSLFYLHAIAFLFSSSYYNIFMVNIPYSQ